MNYLIVLGILCLLVITYNLFKGVWKAIWKNILGIFFLGLVGIGFIAGLIDLI